MADISTHLHAAMQGFGRPSAAGEANILVVAPTAGRFSYLPISAPASAAAGLRRLAKSDAAAGASGRLCSCAGGQAPMPGNEHRNAGR